MRDLLIKVERFYYENEEYEMTKAEKKNLHKAIKIGLLYEDAFNDVTTQVDETREYRQNSLNYPLTKEGHDLIVKNIYQRIRASFPISFLSDIMLFVAFSLSLLSMIKSL